MWKYDVMVRSFEQARSKMLCQTTPYFGSPLLGRSRAKCWKGPKDMWSIPATHGIHYRSPARSQGPRQIEPSMAYRLQPGPRTSSRARPVTFSVPCRHEDTFSYLHKFTSCAPTALWYVLRVLSTVKSTRYFSPGISRPVCFPLADVTAASKAYCCT